LQYIRSTLFDQFKGARPQIQWKIFILYNEKLMYFWSYDKMPMWNDQLKSSMLSIFQLCHRKQGSCLVYVLKISECYISRIAQDLEFIFRVSTINTMIKNDQDLKRHVKFHLNVWRCPFKTWTTSYTLLHILLTRQTRESTKGVILLYWIHMGCN
jgi:hypothetical protein